MKAIDRDKARQIIGDAFEKAGLPRAWGLALAKVESDFDVTATNLVGPDGARGGSYGLTQISERTARAYGYSGPMEALLSNPKLAADLTVKIVKAGNPPTIADLGAWWNAGRSRASQLPMGHVTLTDYIPKLEDAWEDEA